MKLRTLSAAFVVVAGAAAVVAAPQVAHAAGSVTITSPSAGGVLFDGGTVIVDASSAPGTVCVAIDDTAGTQLGFSCPNSPPPSGVYTVQVNYLTPGVGQIVADAQSGNNDIDSTPMTVIEDPGAYHPLTPQRALDTRTDYSGGVGADQTVDLFPTNVGVPDTAEAVVFNLTVTGATAGGFITAYDSQANRPLASNLNFVAGQTVANLTTVGDQSGMVTLYNGSSGTVQVIADIVGYYDTGTSSSTTAAGHFVALSPSRVLDTRAGIGVPGTAPIPADGSISVHMAGAGGVPASGATGVAFTLTATQAKSVGNLRAYPQSAGSTETSSVNFATGQDAGNLVELPLDASGSIVIANFSAGTTHAVADVVGYYTGAESTPTTGGLFAPTTPTRVLDTRYGTGVGQGQLQPQSSLTATLSTLPSGSLSAAALNMTVTNVASVGYLTVWPDGTSRPVASELNFVPGLTTAEADLASISTASRVDVFNGGQAPLDVIGDVDGLFTS